MVSKAREDLPEPLGPVSTISERRGRSRSIPFRLCCRALRMMMRSFTPVVALLGIGRLQRWAGTPEQDGGSGSGRPGSLRGPVVGAGVGERSGWAVHGWSGTGLGPATVTAGL